MKKYILITTAVFQMIQAAWSQNQPSCLEEVLGYEKMMEPVNDSLKELLNVYMHYSVKATNWDNETTTSNVKVYTRGANTHLFSEQAQVYLSEKEILVIMPVQKVVVLGEIDPLTREKNTNSGFYRERKDFLDSCDVIACEMKTSNIKRLVLRVNPSRVHLKVQIKEMIYEYDIVARKLLNVTVNYDEDYRLKQLVMVYHDFTRESSYKFTSPHNKVFHKNGVLSEAYKDFELIDNRDLVADSKKHK